MRIAHISDVHIYRLCFHPSQFLSKQWIGNFNLLFNRRRKFHRNPPNSLIELLKEQAVDCLIISGDLTTTSLTSEFVAAHRFVQQVEQAGITVYLVPGNHDNYTKSAYDKQRFYNYFASPAAPYTLQADGVEARPLNDQWYWLGLDTTIAAGLLRSDGVFSPKIEQQLRSLLASLPATAHILMVNHFPLTSTHPRHDMVGVQQLRQVIKEHAQVKLYLHGHIHRQQIADLRHENLPLLLNSGSCSLKEGASCQILELLPGGLTVNVYRRRSHQWESTERLAFSL